MLKSSCEIPSHPARYDTDAFSLLHLPLWEFLLFPTEHKLLEVIHDACPNQWGEWVSRYLLYVNLKNKLGNTSSYWGFVYCPALYPPNLFKHTQSFQTFPFLHIFGPALATMIWTYFKPRSENTKDQLLTQLISHYSGNQTLRGLNISSCKPMHSCAHKPQFL